MTIEKARYPGEFTFYDMRCTEHMDTATYALHDYDGKSMVFLCDTCLKELRGEIAKMTGEDG